ncbi:MAG: hypothetical protein IJ336_01780 [Lachnospiraceae bacterium]|nr:hypothetical protein [Lachnospiraceae bacterium]
MTDKEIYRIWAPLGKRWSEWVRPVPFVEIHEHSKAYSLTLHDVPVPDLSEDKFKDAAIIVDLPGAESVEAGLAYAKLGYRPIPLFNGTIEQSGARTTVDNQSVGMALVEGVKVVRELDLKEEALPVFMLDSNRLHRHRIDVTVFDNSWDIYAHDMPSADYFIKNNIHKIVVVGDFIGRDLRKILYGFQKKKLEIWFAKDDNEPKKIKVRKPLWEEVE